jgi:hypothetical protein
MKRRRKKMLIVDGKPMMTSELMKTKRGREIYHKYRHEQPKETRVCVECGKKFEVLTTSTQKFHDKECRTIHHKKKYAPRVHPEREEAEVVGS